MLLSAAGAGAVIPEVDNATWHTAQGRSSFREAVPSPDPSFNSSRAGTDLSTPHAHLQMPVPQAGILHAIQGRTALDRASNHIPLATALNAGTMACEPGHTLRGSAAAIRGVGASLRGVAASTAVRCSPTEDAAVSPGLLSECDGGEQFALRTRGEARVEARVLRFIAPSSTTRNTIPVRVGVCRGCEISARSGEGCVWVDNE